MQFIKEGISILFIKQTFVNRIGIVECAAIVALLVSFATAFAASDFAVITTDEVKTLMDRKENMVLIDARTLEEYMEAHIAGAVNRGKVFRYGKKGTFPWKPVPDTAKKSKQLMLKPGEVDALIKAGNKEYVLVDLRDEAEFREGYIPTAINIPV